MAVRKQRWHDAATREKIKAAQLINRLTDHALGLIELSATQVKSIEILLKKVLPDLQAVTVGGNEDNPLTVTFRTVYETESSGG